MKAVRNVGERGQNLAAAYFSNAHTDILPDQFLCPLA